MNTKWTQDPLRLSALVLQTETPCNKIKGVAFRVSANGVQFIRVTNLSIYSCPSSVQFVTWVIFTKCNTIDILLLSGCQMNRARKLTKGQIQIHQQNRVELLFKYTHLYTHDQKEKVRHLIFKMDQRL